MPSRTSGTRLRPHCSHAATTIWRQWARRFSPRSPSGTRALRVVSTGWIAAAPSSTALRTAWSMASLAAMPWASVTASALSRSTGSKASMRATASRLSARASVAANSPPDAGEQRDAIADSQAQHAQRMVRDGVGQHVLAADVTGGQFLGTMKAGKTHATTPASDIASTKSKWKMSDSGR